jgi:hypothetical protein
MFAPNETLITSCDLHHLEFMSALTLEKPASRNRRPRVDELPLKLDYPEVLSRPLCPPLIAALQRWLPSRRWFRGKARTIESISIQERIAVPMGEENAYLLFLNVNYTAGPPELYVLPLA